MKAADVINRVREVLSDEDSTNYRWTNLVLCDYWLNEGMRKIWEKRPDARFDDNGNVNKFAKVAVTGASQDLPEDTLVLGDDWLEALMDFVLYRAFSEDDADEYNAARAAEHRANYQEELR